MHKKIALGFALLSALLLAGCKKELKSEDLAPGVQLGALYYTQFSLFQEKDNFRTTNYRKGQLIPVNTAVTLLSIDAEKAQLKLLDSGQTLTIENVPKFTKDDMQTAFKKIAGPAKVNLAQFSKADQANILAGQVQKGMDRKAVLAAIGYPPQHETPSLDGDNWTYWSNLFNKFIVRFKNGKVDSIVD
ncbi:hypothetical protein [Methylogaea oryzae]|uniref:Outer membrane protein assembly factor BamE n=1 Tax=Methylogaea oryzae TaxID=1295382 RepID=A0A8D4VQH2_9GAMM|nr:hypothetical protein [Methylogaea oryzae]BBL71842.1 hypothetical protein MoryE10_24480 [Methylogaea oryzae]